MKRAFLLIVVPALLVALGFAQTPAASINTDQTNIKGCLGGSDGNYTVVQDNTGHIFKITTSSVDLKPHLGHEVTLIGHKASGVSSATADNSFAVTELKMISEHCAAAAAAPAATVSTPSETTITPNAAAAAPAATVSTPSETTITPNAAAAAPAAAATAPAATVTTPAETVVTPAADATPPKETAVTPAAPAATVSTSSETVSAPAAAAAHPTRMPAHPRSLPAKPAVAATTPAVTASTSPETASTPAAAATTPEAAASTPPETASTPAAVPTTPSAPARRGSLWLLIAFAVLVIVIGILTPSLSRWRRRKSLARTGAPNLSLTREASSDQSKSDPQGPRKVA
jgi:hypothetical protein